MIKGINYWAFTPGADGALPDPVQAMKAARDLGYDQFELTVPESAALDITPGKAEHIRKQAEKIGIRLITLASGIAWGTSPTHPDKLVRQQAVQSYQKMLESPPGSAWRPFSTFPEWFRPCSSPVSLPSRTTRSTSGPVNR